MLSFNCLKFKLSSIETFNCWLTKLLANKYTLFVVLTESILSLLVSIRSVRLRVRQQDKHSAGKKVKGTFTGCILPPERTRTTGHSKKILTVYRPGKLPTALRMLSFLIDKL